MISEFNDGYPPKFVDPLADSVANFDWDAVSRDLDAMATDGANDYPPAEVVAAVFRLLLAGAQGDRINPKAIGLRLLAFGLVLNAANYPGSPSGAVLAARCGVSPAALAKYTAEASRIFNWRSRAQRHAWNYGKSGGKPSNN